MSGPDIFNFTIENIPNLCNEVLEMNNLQSNNIDYVIFHQANKFMLNFLAKKMKLPLNKVPITLEKFGNTSSASIPLALSSSLGEKLRTEELKLVLSGFGVGYSWGAVSLKCGPMIMPELILVS